MKKLSYRYFGLVIIMACFLMILTACKANNNETNNINNTNNANNTKNTNNTNNEDDNRVTIVTWDAVPDTHGVDSMVKKALQDKFDKEHPEINVVRKSMPPTEASGGVSAERIAFTTAIASGNAPDVFDQCPFPTISEWARQGFILPIDNFVSNWEDYEKIYPSMMTSANLDGQIYGVPNFPYVMLFAYNKRMYEDVQLDPNMPPKDWQEMINNAVKLNNDDNSQYGLGLLGGDVPAWWFQFFVWQNDGELAIKKADGTVSLELTSQPVKDTLKLYYDLKWKYNVLQSDITMNMQTVANDFAVSKSGQTLYENDWYNWWTSMGMLDDEFGLAMLPAGPNGTLATGSGGAYYIIPSTTTDKAKQDAAWTYISFMASEYANIERLKAFNEAGSKVPYITSYKSINVGDYLEIPEQWQNALDTAVQYSRPETPLIEQMHQYLTMLIQEVLVTKDADIDSIANKYQKTIQSEVIDPYNKTIKGE